MTVEIQTTETIKCKHCGCDGSVVRYGHDNETPVFYCKHCHKTFRVKDALARMRTPTSQVASALNLYYDGSSVRAIGRHFQQENGHSPSTESIYSWIQKYSQYLTESIKEDKPQNVGKEWIADETVLRIDGSQIWLWDIIDTKTRMLLASRLSRSRTTHDAQMLIDQAIKTAGHLPSRVATDSLASYQDVSYGKDAEHRQGSPFSKEDNTSLIERWHGTLKSRTKVMRGLKNFETANDFTNSYRAYYNYLRPHEALNGNTPAQVAGLNYPYKNWDDLIRNYSPKARIVVEHVPRDSFKMPRNYIGRIPKHIRITPPRRAITRQHYSIGGGGFTRRGDI